MKKLTVLLFIFSFSDLGQLPNFDFELLNSTEFFLADVMVRFRPQVGVQVPNLARFEIIPEFEAIFTPVTN